MYKTLIAIILCLLFSSAMLSQETNETPAPEHVKTITFKNETNQLGFPVIKLGSSFSIQFDVLNGYEDDYYYKIDHYNFDWTKSQLSKSEYLKGYDNSKIYNYKNSFNTYQIYSHYNLNIPNQEIKIIKSGNYIVSILNDYDEVVFSKKIIVYESLSTVEIDIFRSRDLNSINKKDIGLDHSKVREYWLKRGPRIFITSIIFVVTNYLLYTQLKEIDNNTNIYLISIILKKL